ncbi:hypothetical protein [Streptomyces chrestomyceticus]|uniref:hypothetical protein n=1 Tax=Streptomyces chrestomyceticus TaxID=68185 RepID=UPI0019D1EC6E|nr:hypothetical protein [Streptomyces chrestomyceticus]
MTRTDRPDRHREQARTPHIAAAFALLTGALLAGPAALPQAAAAADAPGPRTVPVINGDLAAPAFTATGSGDKLAGWTVQYPYRLLPKDAGHPDGLPALLLRNKRAADQSVSQRLRGVRTGAKVTVTFDDRTGGTKSACSKDQTAKGQPYTLQGSGGAKQNFTTTPGSTDWHRGRSYTFTAGENEPLLTFASVQTTGSWECGPLIAKLRADQVPPPVDKTVSKNRLPAPEAFEGNKRITAQAAADHCAAARNNCAFTVDKAYSYTYYDKARVVGEAYLNCTRNSVQHDRTITFGGRAYDNLSQSAGIARLSNPQDNLHQQFGTGFATTSAEPWRWTTSSNRTVRETVEAGEAAWVEAQAGRQRTDGWFTSTTDDPDKQVRLHVVADGPSPLVPDRVYQRTGPRAPGERERCRSERPTASTPVDESAPAAATDREG